MVSNSSMLYARGPSVVSHLDDIILLFVHIYIVAQNRTIFALLLYSGAEVHTLELDDEHIGVCFYGREESLNDF